MRKQCKVEEPTIGMRTLTGEVKKRSSQVVDHCTSPEWVSALQTLDELQPNYSRVMRINWRVRWPKFSMSIATRSSQKDFKMQEDKNTIPSKYVSLLNLWAQIQENIKVIDASKKHIQLAFVIIFFDFEKNPEVMDKLAVNPTYIDILPNLLRILFQNLLFSVEIQKSFYRQINNYFKNLTEMLKKLPWSAVLCEKLGDDFLAKLLEIKPFNKNLAKAIPDVYLIKKLNTYYLENKFLVSVNENTMLFTLPKKQNTSTINTEDSLERDVLRFER